VGTGFNHDNVLDQWSRSPLNSTNDVLNTMAIAIEITARSNLKEKPTSGTTCDATIDATRPDRGQAQDWYASYVPKASGSLAGAQINVSATSPDWKCYRYKLFQTVVPLRNLIWRP
jgi:type IV pilus assembly protein PilW